MATQSKLERETKEREIEPGYSKVKITQKIDSKFLGLDMKEYGPFKWGDEAIFPTKQARVLEKRDYAVIKRIGEDDKDGER